MVLVCHLLHNYIGSRDLPLASLELVEKSHYNLKYLYNSDNDVNFLKKVKYLLFFNKYLLIFVS